MHSVFQSGIKDKQLFQYRDEFRGKKCLCGFVTTGDFVLFGNEIQHGLQA